MKGFFWSYVCPLKNDVSVTYCRIQVEVDLSPKPMESISHVDNEHRFIKIYDDIEALEHPSFS